MTTVVITGGGTSGHVLPALAIAEMLEDRGVPAGDIHFVGTVRGVDGQLLGETEYPHTLLPVTGLRRSFTASAIMANIGTVVRLVAARNRCKKLLSDLRPDVVVSVGGYGSVAAMWAARRLGIRTVVVSYDSRPGLATRRQARHADVVTVADPTSPLDDAVVTGSPVRRAIRTLDRAGERESARRLLGLSADAFVVGVVGGSLGSGLLNETIARLAADVPADLADVVWYHVTGPRFFDAVQAPHAPGRYVAVAYQHDMAALYAACDVMVTRAGASTIAELATVGVPAIIVPWAAAAENHQEHNARQLTGVGAAVFLAEADVNPARLADEVRQLRVDSDHRERMSIAARALGDAHRGSALVDAVLGGAPSLRPNAPLLEVRRRLHVVGIGGPGMSALARALHGAGHVVSGSDVRESDVVAALRSEGIEVHVGHRASLVDGCDAVCASSGVPADNIEMAAARERGIPALSRAEMLAALCACAPTIAVAGTHGKTSTTALLAVMLGGDRRGCGFVVGGDAPDLHTNGAWSASGPFVVEADESDGTHEHLPVSAAVVTNIDVDHLDHFGSTEAIAESFGRFARNVKGPVVLCADDAALAVLADQMRVENEHLLTYGAAANADVRIENVEQGSSHLTFDLVPGSRAQRLFGGQFRITARLRAQGVHYASNATAAIILALEYGAGIDACLTAMESFRGVGRRFDVRGTIGGNGAVLVDDYAHLPTEIAAVLRSTRSGAYAGRRLVAVFQPNRFHRMAAMSDQYRDAFTAADVVFVTDIYASGTTPIPGVTGELVVDAVRAAHPAADVRWCPSRSDLVAAVTDELGPADVCVSFGCGDIETFPDEVLVETEMRRLAVGLRDAGLDVTENAPMGERTTYKTGGPARVLVTVRSVDDLSVVARLRGTSDVPVLVMGRGSNVLVADGGFAGLCVVLGDFASGVEIVDDRSGDAESEKVLVRIGGATPLPVAARQLSALGIAGFEWAVGVPGTIGGAVRMNAGGHGSDMVASLVDADVFDMRSGETHRVAAADLGLRFRGSNLADHHVVVNVGLALTRATPGAGDAAIADIVRWRRDNQPGGQNAGSVFVNPDNGARSAGEIIDRLGLRGLRIGGAAVSDKHANFIQADAGATSADVVRVMLEVHRRVLEAEGLSLRSEVRLVGFPPGLPFAPVKDSPSIDGTARLDSATRLDFGTMRGNG